MLDFQMCQCSLHSVSNIYPIVTNILTKYFNQLSRYVEHSVGNEKPFLFSVLLTLHSICLLFKHIFKVEINDKFIIEFKLNIPTFLPAGIKDFFTALVCGKH